MKGQNVGIFTYIDRETHKRVTAVAQDREISLRELTRQLLIWAGNSSTDELIKAGVRLPMYPDDEK